MSPTDIAALMAEILETDEVGLDENFFESGGNSFLALALIDGIEDRGGVELRLIDVLGSPTPIGVSELVTRART